MQTNFKQVTVINKKTSPLTNFHRNNKQALAKISNYFESRPPEELLQWVLATFGDKVAQFTSFGPTGMIIIDHLARLRPGAKVITIDTGLLFEETYTLMKTVQHRYNIKLIVKKPFLSLQRQEQLYAPQLWKKNPDLCCHLRKVLPLRQSVQGLDAWITGLRRDQSSTRQNIPLLDIDPRFNMVKVNPLANWTHDQVWDYILQHDIPYNALHDQNYTSIGCIHCTQPGSDPLDERSGRWHGLSKTECGLHIADSGTNAGVE